MDTHDKKRYAVDKGNVKESKHLAETAYDQKEGKELKKNKPNQRKSNDHEEMAKEHKN